MNQVGANSQAGAGSSPSVPAEGGRPGSSFPPPVSGALTGRIALGLALTAALLAVAWYRTFAEMWQRWFPAWHNYPRLGDRITKGDSYYSHGPLVPLTSLVLAFFIYKRVGLPAQRSRSSTVIGWLLFGGGLFFHLLAVSPHAAGVTFVSGFSLLGVLGGLVLLWGGWPLARAYWLPVAILVFMVPLPMEMIADLNLHLKSLASDAAVWATNNIFGVIAVKSGSYVSLLGDPGGAPKTLVVEDVCSGLRSLISLTFFAALFALICRVKGFWRLLMLLMAVPVAIFSNIIRITSLNLVANRYGVPAAGEEGWFHGVSGIMVFAIALGLLFGLEQAIIVLNRLLKRHWVDHRLLGYLSSIPQTPETTPSVFRVAPLVLLVLTAGLTLIWSGTIRQPTITEVARRAVASSLSIAGEEYTGRDLDLDEKTLSILETRDYLYRYFTSMSRSTPVELLIVCSQDNRKGTHPPEVCLKGGGDEVLESRIRQVPLPGRGDLPMRELITQRRDRLYYHLYIYKCGTAYTSSFFGQQFRIFVNGLLSRNAPGALVRITVPVAQNDVISARALAMAAAEELMPQIDRGLGTPSP